MNEICGKIIKQFQGGLVQPVLLHPIQEPTFQWANLPKCIKDEAEMHLHCVS